MSASDRRMLGRCMARAVVKAQQRGHRLSPVEEHHPERRRILTANCVVCGAGVMAEPHNGFFGMGGNAIRRSCAGILKSKARAAELRAMRRKGK